MEPSIKIIDGYNVIEYEKFNIYIIEDIIDDSFCNDKINLINTLPLWKAADGNIKHLNCEIAFTRELIKENDDFHYLFDGNKNDSMIITNNLNGLTKIILKKHIDEITELLSIANNIIKTRNKYLSLDNNVGYNFKKIYGETTQHVDGMLFIYQSDVIFNNKQQSNFNMVRCASIIINLNDDYNGGEFVFPKQDITFKLKKGSILIFPPYWTHPHYVTEPKDKKNRYTISTFACENVKNFDMIYK